MRGVGRSPLHPRLKCTISGLHYSYFSVAARLNVWGGGRLSKPSAQTHGGTILKGFNGRTRCVKMWVTVSKGVIKQKQEGTKSRLEGGDKSPQPKQNLYCLVAVRPLKGHLSQVCSAACFNLSVYLWVTSLKRYWFTPFLCKTSDSREHRGWTFAACTHVRGEYFWYFMVCVDVKCLHLILMG